MIDDYTQQLEMRDRELDSLRNDNFASQGNYKNEAMTLRDQVAQLTRQLDMANASNAGNGHLRDEIERLTRLLQEKDRMVVGQSTQKMHLDGLERENGALRAEVHHLKLAVDLAEKKAMSSPAPQFGNSAGPDQENMVETKKRLHKRELECQALWDTLKDMKQNGSNTFDITTMWALLKKRSLDTKAPRKLEISDPEHS